MKEGVLHLQFGLRGSAYPAGMYSSWVGTVPCTLGLCLYPMAHCNNPMQAAGTIQLLNKHSTIRNSCLALDALCLVFMKSQSLLLNSVTVFLADQRQLSNLSWGNLRLLRMGTLCVKSLVGVGELAHVLCVDETRRGLGEQGGVLQCWVAQ